ncbi:hypothetical protein L9F63_010551 [Diploptera punctata]|uniref:Tudor domain-containing protein n=1 Tax=Diploptera punctata TaxID=6984 RepID=A0AAD8AH60_DIPPU|nr:hypothetical protein L9F63_010551 [Diploptera punctata]
MQYWYMLKVKKYPEKSSINKNSSEKFSPLHQPIQNANDSPIPAVLNLKVGMMGVCQFQHELNSDDFGVSIVFNKVKDDYMRLSTSLINMTKTSSSVDFKPNVGENVIALVQDGRKFWVRAKILAIDESGYRVNLYDFGYVTTSKTIQKLPEDLKSIPEFGSRCTFTNYIIPKNESWCKEEVMLSFTVVAVDELLGTICCNLKSDEREVGTIILKEWIPSIIDYNTVLLSNDDKVVLSIFFSVNCLYIRPVENYFKEKFSKLEQDLSQHCLSAPDVDIMPEKNEIVASKYLDDGKYYRARILQADNDSVKVMYVDFGNVQSVNKSRLKLLPPELRDIPALAVKVSLKNINEKLIMDNAYSFFASLIDKEIEMKVSISDSMKNGIELILPDGRILNNEVNKLAYPKLHEKIQEKSKENILRENNIKYAELPVGKTVQLLVLHKIDSTLLMGCEADEVAMTLIFGTISEEIRKYCESTIEKSYEPKLNELCFAKFEDGSWYRGICVDNDTSTNKDNILFFDFGNTSHIEKTNIRKMTEEFLKLPALGLLCKLNNIKEVQKKQVDSLIEVNKMYEALVISSDSAGSYVIEFPHVTRAIN